jgi:glycosyltransferase involved in cell wall biosynthesis
MTAETGGSALRQAARGPSIGIVGRLVGSSDSWSGIPSGLAGGLRSFGYEPVLVSAEPPPKADRLAQSWLRATRRFDESWAQTAEMMILRSLLVRARIAVNPAGRSTRHWIQMGSEFGHPVDNFVTLEDMTVASAVGLHEYVRIRPAVARAWIRRQKRIYERAMACCVASHWAAESLLEYGVDRAKIRVVGFGCNIKVEVIERDWSLPRFLFVGLDWKRKNGDAVVRAFGRLRDEFPLAQLDLVGSHPDIRSPGVTCHGTLRLDQRTERSRFDDLLKKATCLVLPSTYEPFGIVYAEAGWAGVPSIGTHVGGAPDAIGDGGIVVDPYSPEQIYKAMRAASDPDIAKTLGLRARSHSQLLSWDAVAGRVAGALGLVVGDSVPDLPIGRPLDAASL